jgi:YD repeat-containing protein
MCDPPTSEFSSTVVVYNPAGQITQSYIVGQPTIDFDYDLAGNLTRITDNANPAFPTSYAYDAANRLTGYTDYQQGLDGSFSYNGFGDRVSQTVNGTTTQYLLDPASG